MAIIEALKKFVGRVPGQVWLAVGGLLVGAFWLQQHDARVRQQALLQHLRKETSAQVAALQEQARQDMKQANVENAQAIAKLEARRQQAEQQNLQLAAQLASLRKQAQIQADQVATLPISEIVTRVATQLGLNPEDVMPAAARQSAGIANGATSAPALPPVPQTSQTARRLRHPGAQADSAPSLQLTSSGARKVEAALVDLDACRAEGSIEDRQISNCQARAQADDAAIARLNSSVASLNQALDAKDKILGQEQSEYKAELRAAHGTFLERLARLTEHVAIGVAAGVAIGVAVK